MYPVATRGSRKYTRSPTGYFHSRRFNFEKGSEPVFTAKVNEPNVWEIEIPEPLVKQLREVIAKADEN